MMTTVWSFLLVLSLLILVHELGHFIVARAFGVKVLKFSIGFGPRVWGIVKGDTDYCISAFPLGGFVKMLGEQPDEIVPEEEKDQSFSHKPLWQRAAIVAAGPISNLLFAAVIIFFILIFYGNPVLLPQIGEVQPDSPAYVGGLKPGDYILAVNNKPVETWEELSLLIRSSQGKPLKLTVKRGETVLDLTITPTIKKIKNVFGEELEVPIIGVTAAGKLKIEKLNPLSAFYLAGVKTYNLIKLTFKGFAKIITRDVPLSVLGGPIMIAQMAGQQAQQGMVNLFYFMALLSVNLGLLNLFPIPVLDGGHLFFFAIEAIIGRPLSMRQKEIAQQIGIVILAALMLLVFYNDIARLMGFSKGFAP